MTRIFKKQKKSFLHVFKFGHSVVCSSLQPFQNSSACSPCCGGSFWSNEEWGVQQWASVLFQGTLGQREPSPAPQGEWRQINAEALIFQMKTYYCSLALSSLPLPPSLLLRVPGLNFCLLSPTFILCPPISLAVWTCFAEGDISSSKADLSTSCDRKW